jgi:hypothetical protein
MSNYRVWVRKLTGDDTIWHRFNPYFPDKYRFPKFAVFHEILEPKTEEANTNLINFVKELNEKNKGKREYMLQEIRIPKEKIRELKEGNVEWR